VTSIQDIYSNCPSSLPIPSLFSFFDPGLASALIVQGVFPPSLRTFLAFSEAKAHSEKLEKTVPVKMNFFTHRLLLVS